MNKEERLILNNYIESLYQASQIGDIKFESKHSSELYNLINKLLKENQQLKKQLQQKEDAMNKAREYCNFGIKEWVTDDGFVEEVLRDVKKILDNKGK